MPTITKNIQSLEFWQQLCPALSIENSTLNQGFINFSDDILHTISNDLRHKGYLNLPPVFSAEEIEVLHQAIHQITAAGLPPVFIYVFDQPWALFKKLSSLLSYFLGEHFALLPNFWAWKIKAEQGEAGWPIHQDCQAQTCFDDGCGGQLLMSLSLWIPLSDATLDNGCMYVLPRSMEKSYGENIDHQKINMSDGTALPCKAGAILGWAQDVYHWSGQVNDNARHERVSLSIEFQNTAFEPLGTPLLNMAVPPPFEERVKLILDQFDKYKHMEKIDFKSL